MGLSTFLNGRSYTSLRGALLISLRDTGHVLTPSGTTDSGGGEVATWGTAGTFACRIDSLGGGESLVGDRLSDRSTHMITLAPNSSVSHNDRFEVNGDTYEITAVRSHTSEMARRLEAVRVS